VTPPHGDWNVPPPPRPPRPPSTIRAKRVWAGIGVATLAHLLTVLLPVATLAADGGAMGDLTGYALIAAMIGQVIIFVGCLTVGVVLTVKNEPGFGVGLIIGWAVGLLVAPVVGFGVCILLLRNVGVGG
jgi:hypothetical protein